MAVGVAGWTNPDLILYHGTIQSSATSILAGIKLTASRTRTDFGLGFYTTTSEQQARNWANKLTAIYNTRNPLAPPETPAVVEFTLERDKLASLESIWFVRGDANADDYWDLVQHFRIGSVTGKHHQRTYPKTWFDIAIGPLAASWSPVRRMIADSDQISFHTSPAVALLNGLLALKKRQIP
jgi:hypothetical protein